MKPLIASLLLTILLTPQVQKKENDLSIELLRGKVKTRTETWYTVSSRGGDRSFVKKTRTEYNLQGFKTKFTTINEWNREIKSWDYQYDANGNLFSDSPDRGKTIQKAKDGSWTETTRGYSDLITIEKYGKHGSLLERLTTDRQGKTLSSAKIISSKPGQSTREDDFNADGTLIQSILRTCDAYGNLTEISFLDPKGKQTGKMSYTYLSNNGPLIEYVIYDMHMGSLQRFKTIKFSKPDQKNNWLESIETRETELPFLKIRELEYYPD
ncbi:hypothetical protein IM793_22975 [Pedobacter sp. MR2016-19]|uniref:hypothetical protein n=1 Tax=Pedobacter sp. MR2016-19 TaxID=2780089 RepID=UPI0018748246|nr:hypothetical protein [Pedobacter sp. MR2016-19]MBE5322037.1 hypothetical protein [Pedobacter sp. MR2016-19]